MGLNYKVLRQVFDYFDNDKSGTINSREMDQILKRLDIRLSNEAYNELLREFDRDGIIGTCLMTIKTFEKLEF